MKPETLEALVELAATTAETEHVASIAWGVVIDGELHTHGFAGALLHDDEPAL